ncbi:MAG: hypothetical protein IJ071_00840 [Ruminococcus sp.]|nr:hypothetical protein [Ruminococcus sp.]
MNCPICSGETISGIFSVSGMGITPLLLEFTPSEEMTKGLFQRSSYSVTGFNFQRTPAFLCKSCMKAYPVIDMGGKATV